MTQHTLDGMDDYRPDAWMYVAVSLELHERGQYTPVKVGRTTAANPWRSRAKTHRRLGVDILAVWAVGPADEADFHRANRPYRAIWEGNRPPGTVTELYDWHPGFMSSLDVELIDAIRVGVFVARPGWDYGSITRLMTVQARRWRAAAFDLNDDA